MTRSLQDSVYDHYLTHGAWRAPLHSLVRARYIDSALRLLPTDAYLWQQRSMPLFKARKYEIGMPYLDSAVKYDSGKWLDYRAFMKCIFQKDYRASLEDFEAARRLRGSVANVMDHSYDFYEGLCWLQLEQFDSAEHCFRRSVQADLEQAGSDWVHYLHTFYLGIALQELGRDDEAVVEFDRSLAKYPRFSDAKYYKAISLEAKRKYSDARTTLTEALEDIEAGFTINEDNAIYERYPYQTSAPHIRYYLRKVTEEE